MRPLLGCMCVAQYEIIMRTTLHKRSPDGRGDVRLRGTYGMLP